MSSLEYRISRRDAIKGATIVSVAGSLSCMVRGAEPVDSGHRPLAIATWPFGKLGTDKAMQVYRDGGSTLDAVEQGIREVESAGGSSVGLTGRPNAAGFVQQDACIMHGPGHRGGSVAGIEGIVHPISAARRVMEETRHVMLVGDGARTFAIKCGLEVVPIDTHRELASDWWDDWKPTERREPVALPSGANGADGNHDTVTLLFLGTDGTISGGCSTSGLADKVPGRVGDSPILGSGLYVDNEVGAAGGTGIGENIMRYCASMLIVEAMRLGATPQQACVQVLKRIIKKEASDKPLDINFIALDRYGRYGAAGTSEFPHAVAYEGYSEVISSPPVAT